MTGSWAGAMGHTQFIPSTYLAHAVDFDGNGRRDIWGANPADALASAANYLKASGWQAGQAVVIEVGLADGFEVALSAPGTIAHIGGMGSGGRPSTRRCRPSHRGRRCR